MKKLAAILVIVFALFAVSAQAEEIYKPGKSGTGKIGTSSYPWGTFYGNNGYLFNDLYLYGGTSYYGRFTGTPTANRTWTMPDQTGRAKIACTGTYNFSAGTATQIVSTPDSYCDLLVATNASGAASLVLYTPVPGHVYTILNSSGDTLTFKVGGQTGGTIASGKFAVYTSGSADVYEVYEQS